MLPSEKLELAIYRVINRGAGPVTLSTTMPFLSHQVGESDHAAIADRLEYLYQEEYLYLTKYSGGQPWRRADMTGKDFYHTGSFGMEITPRGRKYFERLEEKAEIEERAAVASAISSSLIFVSCGQSTPSERNLGVQIARLVERETGCKAYFAENQNSLEGVTENILKKLGEAKGFIAIMHPRGNVSNPHNPVETPWARGSIWVEQEIAIAAFISQALQRRMRVRAYVHESIRREGLRDKLHLNPKVFRDDSEVLDDLATLLPSWQDLATEKTKEPFSLKPKIRFRRAPVAGEGEDRRYELLVSVENDGQQDATDATLDVEFPSEFLDGGIHMAIKPSSKPGIVAFETNIKAHRIDHIYPESETPALLTLHYVIRGTTLRQNPESLKQAVVAIVCSGNMKPSIVRKSISDLMEI